MTKLLHVSCIEKEERSTAVKGKAEVQMHEPLFLPTTENLLHCFISHLRRCEAL